MISFWSYFVRKERKAREEHKPVKLEHSLETVIFWLLSAENTALFA
jgi:hypothetical protein